MQKLNKDKLKAFVDDQWDKVLLPKVSEYITIPNQSPLYDSAWNTNGHMDAAVQLIVDWVKAQPVEGLQLEVVRLEGRTPLLFIEVPASSSVANKEDTLLMYGHLDKQPPLTDQWDEGLHPYKPVLKDGKLYGRGGADDGYAAFSAITALHALQLQGVPHPRTVILVEACEESGSFDLPAYILHLKERIKIPSLIICLDSGCGNYEQFWLTTSLRGLIAGTLTVDILTQAQHSGATSGIAASSFRIMRMLLNRIEDVETGNIHYKDLHGEIPPERLEQTKLTASVLGTSVYEEIPFVQGARAVTDDVYELLLNKTWRPTLSVIGAGGIPPLETAGNVLRPSTSLKLSIRLPPTVDAKAVLPGLKDLLEKDVPYGAKATWSGDKAAKGWNSPPLSSWLSASVHEASESFFNKPPCFLGEGGSIPFMGMLGELYPQAQFVITGILGPKSNAHGPNEFLHVDMVKKVTACIACIVADHAHNLLA